MPEFVETTRHPHTMVGHPHPMVQIKKYKTAKRVGVDLLTVFPESEEDLAESVTNALHDPLVIWCRFEKEPVKGVCIP